MKIYYVVIQKSTNIIKGIISDKKLLKEFKQQRHDLLKNYEIRKIKGKKVNKKLKEQINYQELVENEGILLFPDEEEFFVNAFDQYQIDFRVRLKEYKSFLSFIKFSKNDSKVIKDFLKIANQKLNCDEEENEEEDYCDYNNYFNMEEMIKYIMNELS
jgi:hypothetical protein